MATKFENMVDDVLDTDFVYQLMNDAMNEVETMEVWAQLTKEQTYSVTSGYSFTSALGTIPTRFLLDIKMVEDDGNIPYEKVDFSDRINKKNNPLGFFIDLNAGNIHLSGENHSAKTMYFYYTEYSADLIATGSTNWGFPDWCHSIIPLKMAELYYAADAGEKGRAWDDRWSAQYERMLARMETWNDSIKIRNRRSYSRTPNSTPKSLRP